MNATETRTPPPEPSPIDVEYVRLLRTAVDALTTARLYRERIPGDWRPAFADLILLDSLDGQTEGTDDWWPTGNADTAMAGMIAAGQGIQIPDVWWEYLDGDIQESLDRAKMLARSDDEVCGGCGKRWPEGTGEVIECDNPGCPGTCPACETEPCASVTP